MGLYEAYTDMVKEKQRGITKKDKRDAEFCIDSHFEKIKILCRIVTSTKGDDTAFATNLTKFTNSQNDVKVFDFCANRAEQIEIQRKMSKYGYFYERKRGERAFLKNSKEPHEDLKKTYKEFPHWDFKISIQSLAGIFQAYLGKPSYADADYKKILNKPDENDDYKIVFGRAKADITDEKIKNMILALYINKIFEDCKKEYKKASKIWSEYVNNPSDEELKGEFKDKLLNISFLSKGDKNILSKELQNDNIIEGINKKFIEKYELINRGNYMFTALIKYVMDENEYTQNIINDGLFNNYKILHKNLINWIAPLQKKVVKPVFDNIKKTEGISLESFYKRKGIFDKLKDRMTELIQDDDWDLEKEFRFETISHY